MSFHRQTTSLRAMDIETVFTAILVAVFVLIGWFAVYVVYKLYQGQR